MCFRRARATGGDGLQPAWLKPAGLLLPLHLQLSSQLLQQQEHGVGPTTQPAHSDSTQPRRVSQHDRRMNSGSQLR